MGKLKPLIDALKDSGDSLATHGRRMVDLPSGHKNKLDDIVHKTKDTDRAGASTADGGWSRENPPNPAGDGPAEFRIPPDATDAEVAQFHDYANRSNEYLANGQLSDSGRVSTKGEIAADARREARLERARALRDGEPYEGVVAHVPDSTWVGQGQPPGWGDYSSRVNSSLAGQVNRYPVGFDPTVFLVEGP